MAALHYGIEDCNAFINYPIEITVDFKI